MPLFRRERGESAASPEHAVIAYLPFSEDEFGSSADREEVFALEDRLIEAAAALGGEHDGHEFGGGEAVLYTYGPDADELFEAVRRCLQGFPVRAGAFALKRYGRFGDPTARQDRVPLV